MQIEPRTETFKNPPEQFAGDVYGDFIAKPHPEDDTRATVARVRFAPGARSAWHSHARGQYLHVTQGVALFGGRDGVVHEVHPGETLYTPPGEEHWHAADAGCYMEHLALMESADDPADSVTWLEHISDADYEGERVRS